MRKAKLFIQAANICHQQKHYDSAASRCYYAVYRAAIAALQANGYLRKSWNHGTLQRMFNEKLIEEKKEYPDYFRTYLIYDGDSMRLKSSDETELNFVKSRIAKFS